MTFTNPLLADTLAVPIGLGTNTFARTTDETTSIELLDAFTQAGGTFLDTADTYTDGASETIIGQWMRQHGHRDQLVISTKGGNHRDFLGLSASAIYGACEASLRRLGTSHIDIYYAHYQDDSTPIEESVAAFDALVQAGKIRSYGLSNFTAEAVSAWIEFANAAGLTPPAALQPHYNLVHREPFESKLSPIAAANALAVFPYRSLGGGFLTGKYRTYEDTVGAARGAGVRYLLSPDGMHLVDTLNDIGQELGVTAATIALSWLAHQPTVVAPLASATNQQQLEAILATPQVALTQEHLSRLDTASRLLAQYDPHEL